MSVEPFDPSALALKLDSAVRDELVEAAAKLQEADFGLTRERISALAAPLQDYPLYHPQCFVELREAWQWLGALAGAPELSVARWQRKLATVLADHSPWLRALEALGTGAAVAHAARHSRDQAGFTRHLTHWLDGFRTLKFIHFLRDRYYPSVGLSTLLALPAALEILPSLPLLPEGEAAQLEWLHDSNARLADCLFG